MQDMVAAPIAQFIQFQATFMNFLIFF